MNEDRIASLLGEIRDNQRQALDQLVTEEIAVAALGYERGTIPAPPTVAPGHSRLLDGPADATEGITVKSSLGLGGHNSAVVLAPGAPR